MSKSSNTLVETTYPETSFPDEIREIIEVNISKTNKFTELSIHFGHLLFPKCFQNYCFEKETIENLLKWIRSTYGEKIKYNNYLVRKFRVYETTYEYYEKEFAKYDIKTLHQAVSPNLMVYFNEFKECTTHPSSFTPEEMMDSKTLEEIVFTIHGFNLVISKLETKYSVFLTIQRPIDSEMILKTIQNIESVIME